MTAIGAIGALVSGQPMLQPSLRGTHAMKQSTTSLPRHGLLALVMTVVG
jgi:hypothetical protein